MSRPDGSLFYATTTVNLYTTDLVEARALEADLMKKNRDVRNHQRAVARLTKMEIAAGLRPIEDLPAPITRNHRQRRLAMKDALTAAGKYRTLGDTTIKRWRAFTKDVKYKYLDEITPEIAFEYLSGKCPATSSGKNFNNIKCSLNSVFKLTLLDAGLSESPFAKIPNREVHAKHQRPFTEAEFVKIYELAPEPWKTAALISYFTGLREKDVFLLRWDQIDGDVLTTTPQKTARFGRAVQVPLHPQLVEALKTLPRAGERVLGAWPYSPRSSYWQLKFSKVLEKAGIKDTEAGVAVFNSLRNSFITRCDAAGIPRHAVRGIVGHVKDEQTDLYSHDLTTARLVQKLPRVKLGKTDKR
ncbi:MAG: tyrosine-type recombinase/integrase [Victivallaceae bacterium]|nr:tyrosine-type recombinase/integrase [Victivallaceae bacterium]